MRFTLLLFAAIPFALATTAHAQRVDDNAVADAEDAFGSNDGGEDLGVYSTYDVRGFSPLKAGNVRVEGLYMDRQADLSSRLVEGNRIRVGPSAIGYAFPAPSGIVDYRLRTPGEATVLSLVSQATSFGGALVEADAMLPLAGRTLDIGGGASFSRSEYASGNNADILNLMVTAVWRPDDTTEVQPFWSRGRTSDEDIYPIIIGNGTATPPRMTRRRFVGQPWADVESERFTYGGIGRTILGDFGLRGGVFRSVNIVHEGHSMLINAATPGVLAARTVVAIPPRSNRSTSGEIGVARRFETGALVHDLRFIARGRSQRRIYGGSTRIALRPAPFDQPDFVDRPAVTFGAQSDDQVRQWTAGLAYEGSVAGVGQLNLGLQRSHYRKSVEAPAGALPVSREKPWLFNAAATVEIAGPLALYGSYTRGLEESEVAPDIALNRDEAPPAVRTRQVDAGVRLRAGPMTLIAGGFEIEKPYYGLDGASLFRRLGTIRHRGLEASVTGSPAEGWTLVAGGVLLDAELSGDEVDAGTVGKRPVGAASRMLTASVEWRPLTALSFDLSADHKGAMRGDIANGVRVDSYTSVDLGLRYRFRLDSRPAVLRLQATNLLNTYAWEVSGSNAFTYLEPRQLVARLTVDF
ncbi:TonB-dependent receptor domain-containing protein [Sphingoaurantiacus capsulatus]|uniref:TonB-dependent receptor domain-containing protein n=1 Tax=Sphingoaurantiacus capsulatus TaxID=1771310 RepID=A0ABV7XBG7_9SPHN